MNVIARRCSEDPFNSKESSAFMRFFRRYRPLETYYGDFLVRFDFASGEIIRVAADGQVEKLGSFVPESKNLDPFYGLVETDAGSVRVEKRRSFGWPKFSYRFQLSGGAEEIRVGSGGMDSSLHVPGICSLEMMSWERVVKGSCQNTLGLAMSALIFHSHVEFVRSA